MNLTNSFALWQGWPMGNRTNAVKFRHILREFSKTTGHEVYNKTKDWALVQNAALVGVEVSLG